MIFKIDCRESAIFQELSNLCKDIPHIQIVSESLDLGDIIICNDQQDILLLFERKTVSDLQSSITDGRFSEQSFRLNNLPVHNHNICYLVEGDLNKVSSYSRINTNALYSSLAVIMYFKGFSLYKTSSIKETAFFIFRVGEKIHKEKYKPGFYNGNDKEINNTQYCEVVKTSKKSNVTPDNIGILMIMQIPGISASSAQVIMKKYKNITVLIEALKNNDPELFNLRLESSSSSRKISKTSIQNLKLYLLSD